MFDQLPSGQATGAVVPVKMIQTTTHISAPVNRGVSRKNIRKMQLLDNTMYFDSVLYIVSRL